MSDKPDPNRWPAWRTLHLPGGLRVEEFEPGKARFGTIRAGSSEIELTVTSYGALGNDQRKVTGLSPLGCEIFRSEEELDGLRQSSWRPVMPRGGGGWPSEIAEIIWSDFSTAAQNRGEMRLYLIAGAINSQCRFASMRLLDLSNLYMKNLDAILRSKNLLSEDVATRGYFHDLLHSSIHAAFFEIATLRDYIAEYIATVIYNHSADSMPKLMEVVRRNGSTPLAQELELANSPDGWLSKFTELRNTVAHRMPFDRLAGAGFMHIRRHIMPSGDAAWLLHIPLPPPVKKDHKINPTIPTDMARFVEQMWQDLRTARGRDDTLSYLFEVFGKLIDLVNGLASTFPFQPEPFVVTDDDTLAVQIYHDR